MKQKISKRKKVGILLCTLPLFLKVLAAYFLTLAGFPPNSPTEMKIGAVILIPMFVGATMILTERISQEHKNTTNSVVAILGFIFLFIGSICWYF